jgi:hypothetical protein
MNTSALPLHTNPPRPNLYGLGIGLLIGTARWIFECLFVVPLVPDPQSPIWVMISTIMSVFIAATIAIAAWLVFRVWQSKSTLLKVAGVLPLVVLLGWYSTGFINLAQMRFALLDSANPNTGADRLRELAEYRNGPGYEIDNRVAMHPNTPTDVLRSLHGRPDQVGTEMCLAQNSNTPDDILRAIGNRKDDWSKYLSDALKRNPRYHEVFAPDEANADKLVEPRDAAKK